MTIRILQKVLPLLVALFVFPLPLPAAVSLGSLFQDHAVLQQEMKVPIWGKADPDEEVTVSFREQSVSTKADAQGRWRVELAPMKFSAEPAELIVKGSNIITLKDILIGEVWLCSGQSNMEWRLEKSDGGKAAAAEADLPGIRHFKVQKIGSDHPLDTVSGKWVVARPSSAGGFTAVGFYFARDIHKQLGIPVGIVQNAFSGSQIEPWLSDAAFQSNPRFAPILQRYNELLAKVPEAKAAYPEKLAAWEKERDAAKAAGTPFTTKQPYPPAGPGSDNWAAAFYNSMTHPIAGYGIRGALWYQGESNLGREQEYRDLLPALITSWRQEWKQGDFPFYIVQLPSYGSKPEVWARFREAQASALSLPHTGMAVTIDIGRGTENLHPTNKLDVGLRLAAIAKANIYKVPNTEFSGPLFSKAEKDGTALRVTFTHADGMTPHGEKLTGFEIAGADKKYVAAEAKIESNGTILVWSPGVTDPIFIRYDWAVPEANLYNSANLPAAPFRSDGPGIK
ncbi:MAG: sialate O-acetylesterase [Candidatus Methylacidiphilales bacterium]|nr:sialate O-acetylesterase [Candidatus Methylacidiphilales bacterium]